MGRCKVRLQARSCWVSACLQEEPKKAVVVEIEEEKLEEEEIQALPAEEPQAALPISEDSLPLDLPEPAVPPTDIPEIVPEPAPVQEFPAEAPAISDEDLADSSLDVPALPAEIEPEIKLPPEPELLQPEMPLEQEVKPVPEPDLVAEPESDEGLTHEDGVPRAYYGDVKAKLSRNMAKWVLFVIAPGSNCSSHCNAPSACSGDIPRCLLNGVF